MTVHGHISLGSTAAHKAEKAALHPLCVCRSENLRHKFPPAQGRKSLCRLLGPLSQSAALHWKRCGSRKTNLPGRMQRHSARSATRLSFWRRTNSKRSARCWWLAARRVLGARLLREGCENRRGVGRKKICRQAKWLGSARGYNGATAVLISSPFVYK